MRQRALLVRTLLTVPGSCMMTVDNNDLKQWQPHFT